MKLGKLGCLGCGGASLFFLGFVTANFVLVTVPGELKAAHADGGSIREIERDHETTLGRTVREEVDPEGIRHGDYTVWEDDLLVVEGRYQNDRRVGLWRYWHPNGELSQEIHYVRDRAEGLYRHWHDNGRPAAVGSFQHDAPYGPWVYYDARGRLDSDQTGYYVEGNRIRNLTDAELRTARSTAER